MPLAAGWSALGDLVAGHGGLPDATAAGADIDDIHAWMSEPGPMLAPSNGDLVPQNCRLRPGSARLLDFKGAKFQHALLGAAHLRLPFYGGPCWARIPAEVGRLVESAYRAEFGRSRRRSICPGLFGGG
jgi:hypothetical protein